MFTSAILNAFFVTDELASSNSFSSPLLLLFVSALREALAKRSNNRTQMTSLITLTPIH